MIKLFRYLAGHKLAVLLILLLLIVQAWCDLSLPEYTSNIVDIGIQQGGIENATPEQISKSSFDDLSIFLTGEETSLFLDSYDLSDEANAGSVNGPVYQINSRGRDRSNELSDILSLPMAMIVSIESGWNSDATGNNTSGVSGTDNAAYDDQTSVTADLSALSGNDNATSDGRLSNIVDLTAFSGSDSTSPGDPTSGTPDSGALAGTDSAATLNLLRSMKASGALTDEMIEDLRENAKSQMGDFSDSIIPQAALTYVNAEYESLGVDTDAIQRSYLLRTGGIMLLYSLMMTLTAIVISLIAARTSASIGRELRSSVFRKVLTFSGRETEQFSTASLITRSTNDIQQVQMVSVMLLRMVLYAPVLGIGGILKVAGTKTGMSWIIAVGVAAIILLVICLMSVALPKFKILQSLIDRLNLVSREILTGIPVIRAFSREKYEEARFDDANRKLMKTQLFTNRVMTVMMPAMMLIMNGISVLIVWQGAKGVDLGKLQVGDMIAFITYTILIVTSFLMLTMISIMLPRAGVAAARIDEILQTRPAIEDAETVRDDELWTPKTDASASVLGTDRTSGSSATASAAEDFSIHSSDASFNQSVHQGGEIAFRNVSFRYPDAHRNSLDNITFTAEPGKTTAVIGSTGSGKSTILNLLLRFYDVTEGSITLDGIDIREISQKKLRDTIGYVPQKGILFSGTIESNLKFGGNISDDAMKRAARIAQASDFIEEKEDGYQSAVAQDGTNVSGGQRQRLAIARAIAKNPRIFLFDDSFSALDYKTDAALRRALSEEISDVTKIIVAQRISTIMTADQIIVLDEGKIAGIGTHSELMESCTAYREIAQSQFSSAEQRMDAKLAENPSSVNSDSENPSVENPSDMNSSVKNSDSENSAGNSKKGGRRHE